MTTERLGKSLTATLFSALLFALCPSLEAQIADPFGGGESPTPRPAGPHPVDPSDTAEPLRLTSAPAKEEASPRFNVDFSDANVAEACEFIRFRLEELDAENPFNIVVSKEAADIVLPSMQLRQITFEQFARFINRIGGASELGDPSIDDPFAGDTDQIGGIPHKGDRFGISDTEGIWYLWAERLPTDAKAEAVNKLLTKTFHIGDDSEPTLSLIEEALEASQKGSSRKGPALAFHEASKSLIVNGHSDDLKLIEDVVASMRERGGSKRQLELEKEILKYQQDLQEMHRKADFQNRMSEEEKLQMKRQLETRVLQLEEQLVEAKTQFSDLHPKIKQLEAQLAATLAAKDANR